MLHLLCSSQTLSGRERPFVLRSVCAMAAVSLFWTQIKLCPHALQFVYLKEAFSPSLDEKISVLVQARCLALSCGICAALLTEEYAVGPACAKHCIAAPVPRWRAAVLLDAMPGALLSRSSLPEMRTCQTQLDASCCPSAAVAALGARIQVKPLLQAFGNDNQLNVNYACMPAWG